MSSPIKLNWCDIMKYSSPLRILCQSNESFVEWVNVTNDVCNTGRIIKELRIERDLSCKLRVNSKQLNIGQG